MSSDRSSPYAFEVPVLTGAGGGRSSGTDPLSVFTGASLVCGPLAPSGTRGISEVYKWRLVSFAEICCFM